MKKIKKEKDKANNLLAWKENLKVNFNKCQQDFDQDDGTLGHFLNFTGTFSLTYMHCVFNQRKRSYFLCMPGIQLKHKE